MVLMNLEYRISFETYLRLLLISLLFFVNSTANGQQKEFPMIMYAVPATDLNFKKVKELGINYVHLYALTSGSIDEKKLAKIKEYLDLAQEYKLKVMLDLDGNNRVINGKISEVETIVRSFKDHPALGYWYLSDEPDNKGISFYKLYPFYKKIKAISPTIPIAICHGWTKNWQLYNGVQDILLHDVYPVVGAEFPNSNLIEQTKFTNSAIKNGKNKLVIPVIQFFSWSSMIKPEIKTFKGFNRSKIRHPNYSEFRYLCFSTIAQGVDGLAFYSFARNKMTESSFIDKVATPVLKEVINLMDVLDKGNFILKKKNYKLDDLLLSYWENDKEQFWIIVNIQNTKRTLVVNEKELQQVNDIRFYGNTNEVKVKKVDKGVEFTNLNAWEVLIFSKNK